MMRAITYAALLLAVIIAGIGVFGLAAPEELAAFIQEIQKRLHVLGIAAIRVAIGVILLLAAGSSRSPFFLGAIGLIIALGGFVTPFMTPPVKQAVERFIADGSMGALRIWSGIALAVGAFTVYSTMPRRKP